METKLEEIYEGIINRNRTTINEETVGKDIKGDFEGAEKARNKCDTNKNVKVVKPTEGPSSDDEDGKTKPISKKECKKECKKGANMESIKMSFDDLYNKTINEDDQLTDDVVPAADIEGSEFNSEEGDFEEPVEGEEGTDETEEEVDLATELGMIADRLMEIKDKLLGSEETEETEETEEMPEEGTEEVTDEDTEAVATESVNAPVPTNAKKTTLGPKAKQVINNKIGTSGKGKAVTPKMGKDYSGRPSNASKTTLGPKASQNVSGKGPSVTGRGEAFIK